MSYNSTSSDYKIIGIIRGVNLATAAPADIGTISVGAQQYHNVKMFVVSTSAAATLGAATVGLFTAAGGTGTTVVAATLLTNLIGTGLTQGIDSTSNAVLTANALYARLTVASLNAGTADIYIYGYVLTP